MVPTQSSPLMAAVAAYKKAAAELSPEQLQEGVRLLKEVNRRLPSRNLLDAAKTDLKAAGQEIINGAGGRVEGRFLSRELRRFYDAAFAEGLLALHPLTSAAQLPTSTPGDDPDAAPRGAEAAAELVTGLIEEGLQAGMLLSPLAIPASELGQPSRLDTFVANLEGRWAELAEKAKWLLSALRVAIPAVGVILTVTTVITGRDPVGSRANAAFSTGNAMQEVKIMVNLLDSVELQPRRYDTFEELGRAVGAPTESMAEIFELEGLSRFPTVLFLRHRSSGALVMVSEDQRATLADGRIRIRR